MRYLNDICLIIAGDVKMIKIMVVMSTFLVGLFYTRKEIKALVNCITERDYVSWRELNKSVAKRELTL